VVKVDEKSQSDKYLRIEGVFFLCFLSMCDTFMFLELLNNIIYLLINNIFQYCKIILEYFCSQVCHMCMDT
jgi:hypothetical protein